MAFLSAPAGRALFRPAAGALSSGGGRVCGQRPAAPPPGTCASSPLTMKSRGGGAGKKKKAKSPASAPPSPSDGEPAGDVVASTSTVAAAAVTTAKASRAGVAEADAVETEAANPVEVDQGVVDRIAKLLEQSAKRAAAKAAAEAAAAATPAETEDFAANPAASLDEDIPDTPPAPPLPDLTPADARALRWAPDSTVDERLAALSEVEEGAPFERLVMANRHLLGQRFLAAVTARVLKIEATGDAPAAARLRAIRDAVVAVTWRVDQPFHAAVLAAEGRLMAVVAAPNPDRATNARSIGESAADVSAFWTVLYASVTAWEERGRVAPELVNVDVQGALRSVVDRFRGRAAAMEVVRPEMAWLGDFFIAEPADQQAMVAALGESDEGEEILVGLGTLVNQLHLFPVNAYGGVLERLITVYDFAMEEVYGKDTREETVRFSPSPLDFESKLVAFVDASR